MKGKGGLAVIALDNGMAALFADLALMIDEGDRRHLRGKPIQVIRHILGQTAVIVTHAATTAEPQLESAQRTGEE